MTKENSPAPKSKEEIAHKIYLRIVNYTTNEPNEDFYKQWVEKCIVEGFGEYEYKSQSDSRVKELEKEVERLRDIILDTYLKTVERFDEQAWQQFKSENNL